MVEFNCTGEGDGRLYLQGFGGDTSNFAIAAARQGARVGCSERAGRRCQRPHAARAVGCRRRGPPPGAQRRGGLHRDLLRHPRRARPRVQLLPRSGSAASRMRPADLPRAAHRRGAGAAPVGHHAGASPTAPATPPTRPSTSARAAGVAVSFDTNLRLKLWPLARARALISDLIGRSDICLPSLDDLQALTGLSDADAIADHCLRLGARTVALKLGATGALVADAHERHRIAPHPVPLCRCHWRRRHLRRSLRRPPRWPATGCSMPAAMRPWPRRCPPKAMARWRRSRVPTPCGAPCRLYRRRTMSEPPRRILVSGGTQRYRRGDRARPLPPTGAVVHATGATDGRSVRQPRARRHGRHRTACAGRARCGGGAGAGSAPSASWTWWSIAPASSAVAPSSSPRPSSRWWTSI